MSDTPSTRRAANLFDLRRIIGGLFIVYGLLLTLLGLFDSQEEIDKAAGVNILYAAPPEGFRGWCSAEGISSKVTDPAKLQACYDYINWNYNGYLGAVIMRQGYYIANGQRLLPWIK